MGVRVLWCWFWIYKEGARRVQLKAVLQGLLVTFLWSMSWIIAKVVLEDLPPLPFAALRVVMAVPFLLPFVIRPHTIREIRSLTRHDWLKLAALGILLHTLTRGFNFMALTRLPAVTLSLMLNFTAVVVAFAGIVLLAERPTRTQWGGLAMFLSGVVVFFYPIDLPEKEVVGLGLATLAMLSNAGAGLMGRSINRELRISPQTVTLVTMGIGGLVLLVWGMVAQGWPAISLRNWLIILWLASVHTAFAFFLWNRALRVLSAVEASVINNTMLVQTAILAWILLDESITLQEGIGLAMASIGIFSVQLGARRKL